MPAEMLAGTTTTTGAFPGASVGFGAKRPRVETTPANPQQVTGEQQTEAQGLSDADKQRIVAEIITPYRTQWSTDRVLRIPYWLKNLEFDKGHQVLSWDPVSKMWFDSIAAYRQTGAGEEDVTYLERYVNNITQMLRKSYVAAVARGIPPVEVGPERPENLVDATTAKVGQEAIGVIERMNRSLAMVRSEAHKLYNFGVYFKWTRFVIDGLWAGTQQVPVEGEKQIVLPGMLHCRGCGNDTPEDQAGPNCECGNEFSGNDYYPPTAATVPTMTMQEREQGMVKWSVYGPLQVDTDPTAYSLKQVPLLALEMEVDVAELRATFPEDMDKIKEGMESATDPNGNYAKLVRTKVYSQAMAANNDQMSNRVTFTQVWIQPRSYYKVADKDFIGRMQTLYPKGCKVSMVGDVVLAVVEAELTKEWTCCRLDEEYGIYSPAIADNVVPFNERFNNSSNIVDDWFERCAAGLVGFDPNRIDGTQMDGKAMLPGSWQPMPSINQGQGQPLEQAIVQFNYRFEPAVFSYQDRLMNFCQLLSGVPPQVFGGGAQEGVETAKGQKQALDQALGKLGVDWSLIKEEHNAAAQNALDCLQRNRSLCGPLFNVIQERGSEFRSNYVDLDLMVGKLRVVESVDEGLPMTAEEERQWWQTMIDNAEKNPVAQAFMDDPTNQETAARKTGVKDAVVPKAAARSKTLQDIYKLLKSRATPQVDPKTGQQAKGPDGDLLWNPSFAPDKWIEDYTELKATMLQYGQANCDLKTTNPAGWQNFIAYYQLACQYEVEVGMLHAANQLKIQQAGQPQPPAPHAPDPAIQAAKADLLEVAKNEVDRLAALSQLPPLGKNQSIAGQVAAGKELIDTALKVATAGAGG